VDYSTVVRVLNLRHDSATTEIYAGLTRTGQTVFWDLEPGRAVFGGLTGCPIRLGHPVLSICGSGMPSGSGDVRVVGRAAPEVTRIEARYGNGDPVQGWAANGWILVLLPIDRGAPASLVAQDVNGAVIGEEREGVGNLVPAPKPPVDAGDPSNAPGAQYPVGTAPATAPAPPPAEAQPAIEPPTP
jgi:hypothetical protein